MEQISSQMFEWVKDPYGASLVRAIVVLVGSVLIGRLLSAATQRGLGERLDAHHIMVARRAVFYVMVAIGVISGMRELGFSLHAVLGAAGVLSVALGFAAQTSASNLISGLFLLAERPFVIGDVVRIGTTTGEVLSIDLLSTKLRTFDNLYVRVPNESVVKSEVTNMTHFPIRRADLQVSVAYGSDLAVVRQVLDEVASRNPLCLEHPKPLYIFVGLGDSALQIQFSVWSARDKFLELKNSMLREIKEALDVAGIEIPFPHMTLYAGSQTEPLPIRLVGERPTG